MGYHDWHIGMRVACVDASDLSYGALVEGRVYVIAALAFRTSFLNARTGEIHPGVGIRVNGIELLRDDWFSAERFRPLQTRKTDISLFQAMLTCSKIKERA